MITSPVVVDSPAGLRTRLQAVADDIDALWPEALERGDLDHITRVVDASHAVHRALLALGNDRTFIGMRSPELVAVRPTHL
jgi:hypothetical protein